MISIAIVAEHGHTLYLVNDSCDMTRAGDWVAEHVLPKLPRRVEPRPAQDAHWKDHAAVRDLVREFVGDDPSPEFWAYGAAYDWVVLCQLFGTMSQRPSTWPKYCRDVKQEADRLGIDLGTVIPETNAHDALADARWCKAAWEHLARVAAGHYRPA